MSSDQHFIQIDVMNPIRMTRKILCIIFVFVIFQLSVNVVALRTTQAKKTKQLSLFSNNHGNKIPSPVDNKKFCLNSPWSARLILLSVSAFYGTNFGCVKLLGSTLDPSFAASLRFSIAFSVFAPALQKVCYNNPAIVLGGLEVGAYNAFGYWAQVNALHTSKSSTVAFICSLQVIVVPILNALFSKKSNEKSRIELDGMISAVLAVIGVAALELGGTELPGIGDLWAFLQPLAFGLGFWRIEHHMKSCTQPGEVQAFTATSLAVVCAVALAWTAHDFVLPVFRTGNFEALQAAVQTQGQYLVGDWRVLTALIWTGVVTTALTTYGENIAMQHLDAAESTVIYSTEPLWGTLFAALAFGEQAGWNTAVGALFIIAACSWRSAGVGAVASATALQQSALTGLQEVGGNLWTNAARILETLVDHTGDLPEL